MFSSFFKKAAPTSRLDVAARQIAVGDLSPVARLFFEFAFPGFLGPMQDKPNSADAAESDLELLSKLSYARTRRRYAGDILSFVGTRQSDLPRKRYHAVCSYNGNDRGLLRAELDAYTDYERTGFFLLLDMQNAEEAAVIGMDPEPSIVGVLPPAKTAWTRFRDLSMMALAAEEAQPIAVMREDQPLFVRMNTTTHPLLLDHVLDLRLRMARDWFYETYSNGVRGFPGFGEDVSNAFDVDVDREPFVQMLPALQSVLPGGSMACQIIGADLRRRGVKGLVFPSARTDAMAVEENGSLVDWRGFNFVDYRGSPKALTPKQAGIAFASLKDLEVDYKKPAGCKQVFVSMDSLWRPPEMAVDLQVNLLGEGTKSGLRISGPEARREQRMQEAAAVEAQ